MSVWLCIPSARPVTEVNARMDKWRAMGYKIALWRDRPVCMREEERLRYDFLLVGRYPGYARAVNDLSRAVLSSESCDWIVAAGDDTDPEPNREACDIALECSDYFSRATFGVMQPTGDPWRDPQGKIIDRIAGSPWLRQGVVQAREPRSRAVLAGVYPHVW